MRITWSCIWMIISFTLLFNQVSSMDPLYLYQKFPSSTGSIHTGLHLLLFTNSAILNKIQLLRRYLFDNFCTLTWISLLKELFFKMLSKFPWIRCRSFLAFLFTISNEKHSWRYSQYFWWFSMDNGNRALNTQVSSLLFR